MKTHSSTPPLRPMPKKAIPTVEDGIKQYIEKEEAAGAKATDELWSALYGPRTRQNAGKKAAGPALAMVHGKLPIYRLTTRQLTDCFSHRFPLTLSPAQRKKGMSATRGLLGFWVAQGWAQAAILNACSSLPDSPPREEWLHPEQLVALEPIIGDPDHFDAFQRFVIETLRDTGLRVDEAARLKRTSLDRHARVLKIIGKGRGAGKPRTIPVDDDYIERWDAHVDQQGIGPDGWIIFSRKCHFVGGSTAEQQWVPDRSKHASTKAIQNLVARLSTIAQHELDSTLAPTFKLTPKIFRSTYACTQVIAHALGKDGLDLVRLQEAMGHTRLDTTRTYLANVQTYLNARLGRINTGQAAQLIVAHLEETLTGR
jgi:integrase